MTNWYDEMIEEPIRGIVRELRDNGINTTNSCGHEMTVEGDIIADGVIDRIRIILLNYFFERGIEPKFTIIIRIDCENGFIWRSFFEVRIGSPIEFMIKNSDNEIYD
jgi:hypothetical protein